MTKIRNIRGNFQASRPTVGNKPVSDFGFLTVFYYF